MKRIYGSYVSVRTAQWTLSAWVIKTILLIFYEEKVFVYSDISTKNLGKYDVNIKYNSWVLSIVVSKDTARF